MRLVPQQARTRRVSFRSILASPEFARGRPIALRDLSVIVGRHDPR
jgi:hypothetical protein